MIDDKVYDERNQIFENDEDASNDDKEDLKVEILRSKRYIYNNEKYYVEIDQTNMIDEKESYKRDQIGEKKWINNEYIYISLQTDKIELQDIYR